MLTISNLNHLGLLAQNETGGSFLEGAWFWMPLAAIAFIFYFMIVRPERQKKQTHEDMLGGLKKNDRIITIGGILGTVASIQKDSGEVTLKIDEGSNAKLRIRRSAIARVLKADDKIEI